MARTRLGLLKGPALFAASGISSCSLYRWSLPSPRAGAASASSSPAAPSSSRGSRSTIRPGARRGTTALRSAAATYSAPQPPQIPPISALAAPIHAEDVVSPYVFGATTQRVACP